MWPTRVSILRSGFHQDTHEEKRAVWDLRGPLADEKTLDKEEHVVGYFSTVLSTKVDGESDNVPGSAFWVILEFWLARVRDGCYWKSPVQIDIADGPIADWVGYPLEWGGQGTK